MEEEDGRALPQSKLKGYLLLLRPKQWIKNFFVFAALLFSGNMEKLSYIAMAAFAFACFCVVSSVVYIFNDMLDIEKDRKHPKKKNRPLASGAVGKSEAVVMLILLTPVSVYFSFLIDTAFGLLIVLYLVNNVLYTLYVKNLVILDVMSIALGFIIRVAGGAVAIRVGISPWLLLCTLLLALFLGFSKRRNELVVLQEDAEHHRTILQHYSLDFIDNMLSIVTASTVISYSLYTFFASADKLSMITIPYVLYGIFRYQYIIYNKNLGESPEEVAISDKPLLINIILWVLTSVIILYRG